MGERAVGPVGEDLLGLGVAAVVLLSLEHRERRVGEDGVVPPGGEQLALSGCRLRVEILDPADGRLPRANGNRRKARGGGRAVRPQTTRVRARGSGAARICAAAGTVPAGPRELCIVVRRLPGGQRPSVNRWYVSHARHDLTLTTARQAGREARSRHMIAAEGLAAVGRMIAAYRRGDRAATDYEIAW